MKSVVKLILGSGILIALTVALTLAALAYLPLPFSMGTSHKASASPHSGDDASYTVTCSTKERIVNLADPGSYRYLKIEVALEFPWPEQRSRPKAEDYKKKQEELARELAKTMPAIEDALTTILSSRTVAEVTSVVGKDALRQELKQRLGQIIGEPPVRNVYFTQFIVQ